MLSIFDADQSLSRRAMLRVGALGLGGLTLADLFASQAAAGQSAGSITTGKSVIFLMQHGGPTQFETFDPKLNVPDSKRTVGGVCQTSNPGTIFGSTMGDVAKFAHRLAVVRSYTTGSGAHTIKPIVSDKSFDGNIGSMYSCLAGTNRPETGMPTNVALSPNAVLEKENGPEARFGKFAASGKLGTAYTPFTPGGGSDIQNNMKLKLPRSRFDNRRALLDSLDGLRYELDHTGAMEGVEKYRQQAYDVVLQGVADAFDLSKEDPRTIAKYDTAQYLHETRYNDKSNGKQSRRWYQSNAESLGKLLLLARRLCEAGCGFVTVTTRFVWDMHADGNNLGVTRGMEAVGQPFNHALAAFIEDCEERGLSDKILLVTTGEMGRTPKVNSRGGRDHWSGLAPLLLYGGGITHGQVIGQSTVDGGQPQTTPMGTDRLIATMMHTLFDVPTMRLVSGLPEDVARQIFNTEPIPGLF